MIKDWLKKKWDIPKVDDGKNFYELAKEREWTKKEKQEFEKEWKKEGEEIDKEIEKKLADPNSEVAKNHKRYWEMMRAFVIDIVKEEIRKLNIPSRGILNVDKIKSKLLIKQKGKCAICKQELDEEFHIDHIFPYSKKFGYANGFENINERKNLQILCKECNWSKSNK